jgi:CheY-like chemotaxis protein
MASAVPTVYVIDDEPDVLRALSRLLRSEGLQVRTFDDAFAFVAQVDEDFSGCVLLDLSMPELDGLAVQRLLRREGLPHAGVFLSGNGDAVPAPARCSRARAPSCPSRSTRSAAGRGARRHRTRPGDAVLMRDARRRAELDLRRCGR